jgi:hypothetical protein
MKRLLPVSLLLYFSFLFTQSFASHMAGAEITYRCLGSGKYKIIAKVYRDCRGISFNSPTFRVFAGTNGGDACGGTALSFTRTGIKSITPICSTGTAPCIPANTFGTGEGIEEHIYETTVDFTVSPLSGYVGNSNCCEVTFAVGQCCRNGAITTGPANNDYWATCMLNICNIDKTTKKCNSAPDYTLPPYMFLCCNQVYRYNNGITDTVDFDSINVKFASGLGGLPKTSITYSSPFSARYPLTPYCIPPGSVSCAPNILTNPPRGLYINEANGDIVFTPTKCDEYSVVVVEATEYRKDSATGAYLMIGKSRRDVNMMVTSSCDVNKSPTIDGPSLVRVCEGEKVCFKINSYDETYTPNQTIPDTLLLTWNKTIPRATFTILNPKLREKTAEFCWQTRTGDVKEIPYHFTVTANDQHCSKPAIAAKGFQVLVTPRAISKHKYRVLNCGKIEVLGSTDAKGTVNYSWTLRDSTDKTTLQISKKKADTISYMAPGKHILVHTLSLISGCTSVYRDTLFLPAVPTVHFDLPDTSLCFGSFVKITPVKVSAKSPYRYYWGRPKTHIPGDTLSFLELNKLTRDTIIAVRVTDANSCRFSDTISIKVLPLPVVQTMPDQRICSYGSAIFDAGFHNDTVRYEWSSGEKTRTVTQNKQGVYVVKIMDTNTRCSSYDSVFLFVNDTVNSNAGNDVSVCNGDSVLLTAAHAPTGFSALYTWTELKTSAYIDSAARIKIGPTNSNPFGGVPVSFDYVLKTSVNQGGRLCEDSDTVRVKVYALPQVYWSRKPLPEKCFAYGDIELFPFVNPQANAGIVITSKNKLIDSINAGRFLFKTTRLDKNSLQSGKYHTEKIYLQFTDSVGCVNMDSTEQRINSSPIVSVKDTQYQQSMLKASMNNLIIRPVNDTSSTAQWTVLSVPTGVNAGAILFEDPAGSNQFWMRFDQISDTGRYQFKYCVTQNSSGCDACDTSTVWVVMKNTGLKNLDYAKAISIWPNPLQQGFWTVSSLPYNGFYEIYSTDGKLVNRGRVIKNKDTKIEVLAIERGTHLLTIRLEDGSFYMGYLVRK